MGPAACGLPRVAGWIPGPGPSRHGHAGILRSNDQAKRPPRGIGCAPTAGVRFAPVRIAATALWLVAAAAGSWCLSKYESAPGRAALTPDQWPVATRIAASHDCPTLLMFAHPQCPCTRASIENLNRL